MGKLPGKEELEQLYHEKGHDALVWYVWRFSLRALPLLGACPLAKLWDKEFCKNVYLICLPCIMLSQWETLDREILFHHKNKLPDFFSKLLNGVRRRPLKAVMMANYYAFNDSVYGEAFGQSINFDEWPGASEESRSLYIQRSLAARNHILDAFLFKSFSENFTRDCWNDYDLVRDLPESITEKWSSFDLKNDLLIHLYGNDFLDKLKEGGLSFLATDLKKLWGMKPLDSHTENYFKVISEADLNNPEALRRIILGDEADKIHAVRTLLLGPGGAGKSSLADRLQGKPIEQIKTATPGIEYQNHQPLDLQKNFPESNPEEKDLSLYLWDFGGQTIFHGLHRAFLHENCVYILVVDSRHEQVPDEWLHQIRHLAGGNTTVLLVTNQHDGCDIRQNEKRLLREFPDLLDKDSFHYFSCIDPEAPELTKFVNELSKAALDSQKTVWKETLNIHQAIREYTKEKSAVFIATTQIKKIIRDNGRVENSKAMINSLEQLGFLASITKGKLSYCLKPEWAVDRAYELLYSDTLRNNKGKLDLLDLDECFATAPTEQQQSKLLDFLDHRSLCFELPESGEYFFPDAAPADEPEFVADLLKQKQRLQIRFDLPYLPLGFHTRLIKPLFNQETGIKSSEHIWRQGFIQQSEDSHAIVQYLLRKSSIEVTLVGNPQQYASLLDKFYAALRLAVAENKTGLQAFNIRPFVFLEKQLFELDRVRESQAFSVHSVVELVKVLQAANGDLKQVYEDVRDMAADKKSETHHHYHDKVYKTDISGDGQTAVGSDHAMMNQYLDKSHTEITADQRNQIATIVGELLQDAGNLPTEQLAAVTETKKALEAPADDTEAKNLLGKVWNGIDEVATFTKDKALPIADFAIKHKESLGAALAATIAAL